MSLSDSPARQGVRAASHRSSTSQLAALRQLMDAATESLLGDTISVSDDEWRGPSRLPGWTRGHVATHLARQADGLVRVAERARTGVRQRMYPSPVQRDAEITMGGGRPGVELQKDLDTSAQRLDEALDEVDAAGRWDAEVELRDWRPVPARLLPLARLAEVVLHLIDLDDGFDIAEIDRTTAEWLLEWSAFRLRSRSDFPALALRALQGFAVTVGAGGEPIEVRGSPQRPLGWITGRADGERLRGADGVVLPPYA